MSDRFKKGYIQVYTGDGNDQYGNETEDIDHFYVSLVEIRLKFDVVRLQVNFFNRLEIKLEHGVRIIKIFRIIFL